MSDDMEVKHKVIDLMAALKESLGARGELIAPESKRPDLLDELHEALREPEEGEPGYRCPNCGELYDSKCRTPADRVCFQCRVGA